MEEQLVHQIIAAIEDTSEDPEYTVGDAAVTYAELTGDHVLLTLSTEDKVAYLRQAGQLLGIG